MKVLVGLYLSNTILSNTRMMDFVLFLCFLIGTMGLSQMETEEEGKAGLLYLKGPRQMGWNPALYTLPVPLKQQR